MTGKPKVFGLGLFKTGTTSLGAALARLGYDALDGYGLERINSGEPAELVKQTALDHIAGEHDAFEDFPWFLMHRELDAAYPGSKFILTVRDERGWWRSHLDHFGRSRDPSLRAVYGVETVLSNKHALLDYKRRHEQAIRAYFADRPEDFLELNLCAGQGWETLCPFLGLPSPDEPMPRRNNTSERDRNRPMIQRLRRSLSKKLYRIMYG